MAIGVLALSLLPASCGGDAGGDNEISKNYGNAWPFTVSSGTLSCDGPGWVTFTRADETYAVNGLASGHAPEEGWQEVDEIWANDPDVAGMGMKKDIGPILDDGLKLCEDGGGSIQVSGIPGSIGKDPDELPPEEEQQEMGLHTFSDFTPAQKTAYVDAYDECTAEFNAGNYTIDIDAVGEAAESAQPGTGDAAWEGCSDAISGTPISGSGIEPPP